MERRRAIETHGMIQTLAIELQASSGPFENQDSSSLNRMTERFAFSSNAPKQGVQQTAAGHRCRRALDVSFVVVFLLEWIFRIYLDRMQLLTCIQLYPDHSRSFFDAFLGAITSSVGANQSGFTFGCPNHHQQYRRVPDGSGVNEKKQAASDWSCFVLKRRTFHFRTPCITPCPAT